MNQYTVTVMATHQVRESYVVFSDKTKEELEQDIKNDPFQLYCGGEIDMLDDEFLGCTELVFDSISQEEKETP